MPYVLSSMGASMSKSPVYLSRGANWVTSTPAPVCFCLPAALVQTVGTVPYSAGPSEGPGDFNCTV